MLDREAFLTGIASAFAVVSASIPQRAASAALPAVPSPGLCLQNSALPYDKHLEISMRVLDGPDFNLLAYRGNVVWLNIFATWCGPCNLEQPVVVTLAKEYFDRGLRVIGIDDSESDNAVRAYRKKYGIEYPIAMDEDGGFASALGDRNSNSAQSFPAHLLIDRAGYLSCYFIGSVSESEIIPEIEALLGSGH